MDPACNSTFGVVTKNCLDRCYFLVGVGAIGCFRYLPSSALPCLTHWCSAIADLL